MPQASANALSSRSLVLFQDQCIQVFDSLVSFMFLSTTICESSASFSISKIPDMDWILHSSSQKW